jgi:hypothetical protein
MPAILPRTVQRKNERHAALLGVGLNDVREENFCLMVADGVAMSVAFQRSGFTSENTAASSNLFHLDRIQKRVNDILEARRTTGVVTLGEVTDMLHRVFVGAWHKEEYSAAHNAAFSLARLYGHVTDRSTVEVIRRPSRDPDAPSEQALSSWVNSLPIIDHEPSSEGSIGPLPRAPADLLGTPPDSLATPANVSRETLATPADNLVAVASPGLPASGAIDDNPNDIKGLEAEERYLPVNDATDISANASHSHLDWLGKSSDVNGLAGGRPENGAPAAAVTGTPNTGAHSSLLGDEGTRPTGGSKKGAPLQTRQVPGYPEGFEWPDAKDLF